MTALAVLALALASRASDPPHDGSWSIGCSDCHSPHDSWGGTLNIEETTSNTCLSCHTAGGSATALAFADGDQADPGTSGTSHRWDSGPAGHAEPDPSNTSPGTVGTAGTFTGRTPRTWTITISSSGDVGAATFTWSDDAGNSGSATTAASVSLSAGVSATFADGDSSPAFVAGDTWTISAVPDLRLPSGTDATEREMAARVEEDGTAGCPVCHDPHSQEAAPADPSAPAYSGPGTGEGRHFMRVDNDTGQACTTCHSARDVADASAGSHPVGVAIPGTSDYTTPTNLDLYGGSVACPTCHGVHFADSGGANGGAGDGFLLRTAIGELCGECHAIAGAGAAHLDSTTGVVWPGGERGSSAPARSSAWTGACVNCHWPHGWPDDASGTDDYPLLLVERTDVSDTGADPDDAEDLCFTCHDGAPAEDIESEFAKGTNGTDIYHHPVVDSEQSAGRSVECTDCHEPHSATASDPTEGAGGIAVDGTAIAVREPTEEYEVCFKCHGDDYNAGRSRTTNKRTDFDPSNSAYHPVAAAGRNTSSTLDATLLGGLTTSSTILCSDCHNNEQTADAEGAASNSTSGPQGPHGSTQPFILRAAYWTDESYPGSYSRSNFALCFLCHDPAVQVETDRYSNGARTNFMESGGKNLHHEHVVKKKSPCIACHYNAHSNENGGTTDYLVDGTTYSSPPAGAKTRLVAFSPILVTGGGGKGTPTWALDTSTRRRDCYLTCHGKNHDPKGYTPPSSGDDDSLTIP